MSAQPAVVTAVTPDRLPGARVLATTLAEHHPDLPVFVALRGAAPAGREPSTSLHGDAPAGREPFTSLHAPAPAGREPFTTLDLAAPAGLDPMTACCVLKARALDHLLDAGHAAVLYLDADMASFGPLDDLLAAVNHHPRVLSPHLVEPGPPDRERLVLVAGTYNGGLVGVRDTPPVRRFLAWWRARIEEYPVSEPAAGINHDQRWLDLAPGLVAGLHVLRAPDLNVGHWRLPAARRPRLAHFSGFDPARPELVSRHAPGLRTADAGAAGPLHAEYARRLSAASQGAPTLL